MTHLKEAQDLELAATKRMEVMLLAKLKVWLLKCGDMGIILFPIHISNASSDHVTQEWKMKDCFYLIQLSIS